MNIYGDGGNGTFASETKSQLDKTQATGYFAMATNPSDSTSLTINGTTFNFKTVWAVDTDVQVGIDLNTTLYGTNGLFHELYKQGNTNLLDQIDYSHDGTNLLLKAKYGGTLEGLTGNNVTLASATYTPSAANLTGGSDTPVTDWILERNIKYDITPIEHSIVALTTTTAVLHTTTEMVEGDVVLMILQDASQTIRTLPAVTFGTDYESDITSLGLLSKPVEMYKWTHKMFLDVEDSADRVIVEDEVLVIEAGTTSTHITATTSRPAMLIDGDTVFVDSTTNRTVSNLAITGTNPYTYNFDIDDNSTVPVSCSVLDRSTELSVGSIVQDGLNFTVNYDDEALQGRAYKVKITGINDNERIYNLNIDFWKVL